MSHRRSAQERDFNRRRSLILEKGFDLAHNQQNTNFGICLLRNNITEVRKLEVKVDQIDKQEQIELQQQEQHQRHFIIVREKADREPTVIMERVPDIQSYADYVDLSQPRYRRNLQSRQGKPPEFSIICAYKALKTQKHNTWDKDSNERRNSPVLFKNCISSPSPVLSASEKQTLLEDWQRMSNLRQIRPATTTDIDTRYSRKSTPISAQSRPIQDNVFITQMHNLGTNKRKHHQRPVTAYASHKGKDRYNMTKEELFSQLCEQFVDNRVSNNSSSEKQRLRPQTAMATLREENESYTTSSTYPLQHKHEIISFSTVCQTKESAAILAAVRKTSKSLFNATTNKNSFL